MKALILAAGMGTRLMPLTADKPKILVEVNGVPLLKYIIEKLYKSGFDDLVINLHHKAEQIIEFVKKENFTNIRIQFSYEKDKPLETGGAILHARNLLEDAPAFLIYNGDVLTSLDVAALYQYHTESDSFATLAVKERESSRHFLFNKNNILIGWENLNTGERIISRSEPVAVSTAFSAVHVLSSSVFRKFTEQGVFSMRDTYLRLSPDHDIRGYFHEDDVWMDIGSIDRLKQTTEHVVTFGFPGM